MYIACRTGVLGNMRARTQCMYIHERMSNRGVSMRRCRSRRRRPSRGRRRTWGCGDRCVCVLRRLNGLVAQAVPLVDLDQTHTPWSMAHLLQRCRYLLLRSTTQQLFNHVVECTADNTQPPAINVRGVVLCCVAWCLWRVVPRGVVLFVPAHGCLTVFLCPGGPHSGRWEAR